MNEHETFTKLHPGDVAAVALYFLVVLGVGFYAMFRANRGTISGYFLAGRLMTWLPVGASMFASNIGSEHFIGLAGSGASAGIAVGAFEINACILIQLLGWVFLPVFIACGVCTLPEYMNKRFGGQRIRTYLACLSMVLYIFTKVSVNLYAGALFIEQSLHWNLYPSILFILFMTCVCTVTGGLAAVIYTDTIQTIIMLIGSITLTVFAFNKVGGYHALRQKYMFAIPASTYDFVSALQSNSTQPLLIASHLINAIPLVGTENSNSTINNLNLSTIKNTDIFGQMASSLATTGAPFLLSNFTNLLTQSTYLSNDNNNDLTNFLSDQSVAKNTGLSLSTIAPSTLTPVNALPLIIASNVTNSTSLSKLLTHSLDSLANIRSFLTRIIMYGDTHPSGSITNSTVLAAKYALCGLPHAKAWQMLRPATDEEMPWPGFLFGQTAASIWYWCADQMMVQRALAAKDLSHAQGGTLFAGYLKMLPLFIIIFPGMISRVLFPDKIACATPEACKRICGNPTGCSNLAYPTLVLNILPVGLKGLMLAVMLAALMSDLTSIFNSASTLFTMDVWKICRPRAKVRELLIVGRLFVLIMTVIGIIWIPVIQLMQGGQLYIYIQSISAYLSPPIACVYLLAVLWPRCNEQGAFWSLMVGMCVGVTRMVLDFVYRQPYCGEVDRRPALIARLHYMYFAMVLFWITAVVCFFVSLLTKPTPKRCLVRSTYWTRFDKEFAHGNGIDEPGFKELAYRVNEDLYDANCDLNNNSDKDPKSLSQHGKLPRVGSNPSLPPSYSFNATTTSSIDRPAQHTLWNGSLPHHNGMASDSHLPNLIENVELTDFPLAPRRSSPNSDNLYIYNIDNAVNNTNVRSHSLSTSQSNSIVSSGPPDYSTITAGHQTIFSKPPPAGSEITLTQNNEPSPDDGLSPRLGLKASNNRVNSDTANGTLAKRLSTLSFGTSPKNGSFGQELDEERIDLKDGVKRKNYERSLLLRFWDWFLGYDDAQTEQQANLNADEYRKHMAFVTSLHQGRKSKICLNINLVFIITVAIFMFIYFTFVS